MTEADSGMGCIFIAWLFVMTLILAPILAVLGYAPWWIGHADSTLEWLALGIYYTALGAATLGCAGMSGFTGEVARMGCWPSKAARAL